MDSRNQRAFELSMGDSTEEMVRKGTIILAVIGFLAHFWIWALHVTGRISIDGDAVELVSSPLSSLYTPFSILLVYEVYQLIRTIPDSFSSSVGKQYEIATLLVVRDILKRLSEIEGSSGWEISDDLGFLLVESGAFLAPVLHLPDLLQNKRRNTDKTDEISEDVATFVETKNHSQYHANCLPAHRGLFFLELGHLRTGGRVDLLAGLSSS